MKKATFSSKYFKYYRYGIEMEFSTDLEEIYSLLKSNVFKTPRQDQRLRKLCYQHSNGATWDLKYDSSTKAELCTPIIDSQKQLKTLSKILNVLNENGVKNTKKDGLHLHVSFMSDDTMIKYKLAAAWLIIDDFVRHLVPAGRRRSMYCERLIPKSMIKRNTPFSELLTYIFQTQWSPTIEEHHSILNIVKHVKSLGFTHLEFRLPPGTKDEYTILNWLKFITYFIEYAQSIPTDEFLENMVTKTAKEVLLNQVSMSESKQYNNAIINKFFKTLSIDDNDFKAWVKETFRENNYDLQ